MALRAAAWAALSTLLSGLPPHPPSPLLTTPSTVLRFHSDDEAVAIANDCPFGLGSNVFSGSRRRALALAARLEVRDPYRPARPDEWLG